MKNLLNFSFILATSLSVLAASPPDDAKAIQGNWTPSKAELSGQAMTEEVMKSISHKLTKDQYEVSVAGNLDKGTYTLDSTGKPRGLSITGTEGPNRGKTFPAIYELEGDTLRICYDLSGTKRHTEFKSLAGTRLFLVTYNRKQA
jgi:uncharacterized protein (TIGR03067 family)